MQAWSCFFKTHSRFSSESATALLHCHQRLRLAMHLDKTLEHWWNLVSRNTLSTPSDGRNQILFNQTHNYIRSHPIVMCQRRMCFCVWRVPQSCHHGNEVIDWCVWCWHWGVGRWENTWGVICYHLPPLLSLIKSTGKVRRYENRRREARLLQG